MADPMSARAVESTDLSADPAAYCRRLLGIQLGLVEVICDAVEFEPIANPASC